MDPAIDTTFSQKKKKVAARKHVAAVFQKNKTRSATPSLYDGGKGARHNLISPSEATSYFTIRGKSLPRYISR